jgi:hypothetical protein
MKKLLFIESLSIYLNNLYENQSTLRYRQVPNLRPQGVLRLTRRRYHFANLKPGGLRLAQHGIIIKLFIFKFNYNFI